MGILAFVHRTEDPVKTVRGPSLFFRSRYWPPGYVGVDLKTVDEQLLQELPRDAWLDALPVVKAKRKRG